MIGAGQAGLSAAYHLRRRGFVPVPDDVPAPEDAAGTFVVLDQNPAPGGAWQHRWESLRMATVNGIHELPGMPVPPADPREPSREALPPYFAAYERRFDLRVRRPVTVRAVRRDSGSPGSVSTTRGSGGPDARVSWTLGEQEGLRVETDAGAWHAGYVINATGTWTAPYLPAVPGTASFRGRQLHVHDYVAADEFAGRRVVIVGAGISAVQLLDEISHVAETFWVTRAPVDFTDEAFDEAARIAAIAGVEARVRQGLPVGSVISVTGQHWTPWARSARERGVLVRHPMFTRIEPEGVRMPDGTLERADAILWATGFRPAIRHLAPLRLRTPDGGIRVANGRSLDEPRLFLIGYGPSQSTVGANRAGRDAVRAIASELTVAERRNGPEAPPRTRSSAVAATS